MDLLNDASEGGAWGLTVVSVKIDKVEIADETILKDLESFLPGGTLEKRTF